MYIHTLRRAVGLLVDAWSAIIPSRKHVGPWDQYYQYYYYYYY